MIKKIDYATYLDKVKGCFLGKTVIGTLGAPYEGVKMPMELLFMDEMINTMLPNDDLDLQVLWLDVAEKYGVNFTSKMLQQAFVENCDYSPGEYAIMRKNFQKGIFPPYSGSFCNDFYVQGMGCPIRSEIWACLAPGNPELAADFSSRDGVLDHKGESVYAERFFAAMEATAFFESDLRKLIEIGFTVIPNDCKFRAMVEDVLSYCNTCNNIKDVLALILFKYGHPDCTNMFQNMGIVLASLIFGEYDMIKTGMIALNCGFDTDCTCASAGALIGIILGEKEIQRRYNWGEIRYVLSVRSNRRSDLVSDLSEDIALLGARFSREIEGSTQIIDAPDKQYDFVKTKDIIVQVDYENDNPSIGTDSKCVVNVTISNNGTDNITYNSFTFKKPDEFICRILAGPKDNFTVACGESVVIIAEFSLIDNCDVLCETNIISFCAKADQSEKDINYEFGISGNRLWKMTGPIWKTLPETDEKILGDKIGYWHAFTPSKTKAEETDKVRFFHLNFDTDTSTQYFSEEELFAPLGEGSLCISRGGNTLFARPYVESRVETQEDFFTLDQFMGFKGPCVVYLSQILISPEERNVCIQLGHSSPFELYINGELIGRRDTYETWTSENAHFENVHLKKGENKVVLRLTRSNSDAKYSLIYSKGLSCSTHYCDFATKKI